MDDPDDLEALARAWSGWLPADEVEDAEGVGDDDAGDDDDDAEASSAVEDLGLPMPVLPEDVALELLAEGELSVVGRLWASSNNALLCLVTRPCPDPEPDLVAACIYKPVMGERPLDDFPDGTLARREVAAFETSRAGGFGIVPPTVLRDGPFGEGMVQLWIRTDDTVDPVALVIDEDQRLRSIAVFDAAVNNTDRKAGHLLPVPGRARLRRRPRRHVLARAEAPDGPLGVARRAVPPRRARGAPAPARVPRRRPRRAAAPAPRAGRGRRPPSAASTA